MNSGMISEGLRSALEWLGSLSGVTWAFVFLLVSGAAYWLEAGQDDDRREAAFAAHSAQPDNPTHLARFVALTSIATGKRTISRMCFVAAWALRIAVH